MSNESTSRPPILQSLESKHSALRIRHTVVQAIRRYFDQDGFVEVTTPQLLKTVATEEHIEAIRANNRYLATSPELEMKLLVASGLEKVYQITRSHRRGELGRLHQPEFAILEWYRPGTTLEPLIEDLEALFRSIAEAVFNAHTLPWNNQSFDLSQPFLRTAVESAFTRFAGWNPLEQQPLDPDQFDLDLVEQVEPQLGQTAPEVLFGYPAPMASLARLDPDDPRQALRMELYVDGVELANGFVELNDSRIQRDRFRKAAETIRNAGRIPPPMPETYLGALHHLPDTVGIAVGLDRLVMLFANQQSIHNVVAFEHADA